MNMERKEKIIKKIFMSILLTFVLVSNTNIAHVRADDEDYQWTFDDDEESISLEEAYNNKEDDGPVIEIDDDNNDNQQDGENEDYDFFGSVKEGDDDEVAVQKQLQDLSNKFNLLAAPLTKNTTNTSFTNTKNKLTNTTLTINKRILNYQDRDDVWIYFTVKRNGEDYYKSRFNYYNDSYYNGRDFVVMNGGETVRYNADDPKFFDILDENGDPYEYTIEETKVTLYASNNRDGRDVTENYEFGEPENINTSFVSIKNYYSPTLTFNVTKTWVDEDNKYGRRPSTVTATLTQNGIKKETITLSEENGWIGTFAPVPKYDKSKNDYVYKIEEGNVPNGYVSNVTSPYTSNTTKNTTITNTWRAETVNIPAKKVWKDNDNKDGSRPKYIVVELYADGKAVEGTGEILREENNWSHTYENLLKYDYSEETEREIVYTVKEYNPDGRYDIEIGDADNDYTITNTLKAIDKTEVRVSKVWDDNNDNDGKRPESITYVLQRRSAATENEFVDVDSKTKTVTAEDNWEAVFTDLEKYDEELDEYFYRVIEKEVEGYVANYEGVDKNNFTLVNTHEPELVDISITKTWVNDTESSRPDHIVVKLYADGEEVAVKDLDSSNIDEETGKWKYTFVGLPKYKAGKEIKYTVTERNVEGYETTIDGLNITNTRKSTVRLSVVKEWVDNNDKYDLRPVSIDVGLLADGVLKQVVTLSESNLWSYNFTNLPKYNEDGDQVRYRFTEIKVPEFYTSKVEVSGSVYKIVNTYSDDGDKGGVQPPTPSKYVVPKTAVDEGFNTKNINIGILYLGLLSILSVTKKEEED